MNTRSHKTKSFGVSASRGDRIGIFSAETNVWDDNVVCRQSDEPFTGWVKSENNGTVSQLGYLQKGKGGHVDGVVFNWH